MSHQRPHMDAKHARRNYAMLSVNLTLSLAIMYFAMFAMIWSRGDFVQNINFFYVALIMWAPMSAVMMLTMSTMFTNRKLNIMLCAASRLCSYFRFGRSGNRAVGDKQFLQSVIPHHSGAILICERAQITDPEIEGLCQEIIRSQAEEIDQMKVIRQRL